MKDKPAVRTPSAEAGFASPPCYAAEFPGYFGEASEVPDAVVLYKTIRRLGGEASHETGAFLQKTLAIDGLTKRLRFVNKGQAWVVRKINEVLPLIDDDAACRVLENMRRSHLENIAACDALLAEEG